MTGRIGSLVMTGLSLLLLQAGPSLAQAPTDEGQLQGHEQGLNQGTGSGRARAEALAHQFNVPVSTVEEMRSKKQGWGSITIQLAMAAHLVKQDPTAFPTMSDALGRIASLRAEGRGWGNIAKEMGFKLGPVVSDVQRVQQELRAEARSENGRDRGQSELRAEGRADRPDRPARPERPDRPVRPERPDRPGR